MLMMGLYPLQEGNKTLIVHLVETYSSKLESIDYVDTFKALKLKYEQVRNIVTFSDSMLVTSALKFLEPWRSL